MPYGESVVQEGSSNEQSRCHMDLFQALTVASQFLQGIGGISFLITTWVALKVYDQQKQDAAERLEKENKNADDAHGREYDHRGLQLHGWFGINVDPLDGGQVCSAGGPHLGRDLDRVAAPELA